MSSRLWAFSSKDLGGADQKVGRLVPAVVLQVIDRRALGDAQGPLVVAFLLQTGYFF